MPVNRQFSTTTASSSGGGVGEEVGVVGEEVGLGGGGEGGRAPHPICSPLIRNPL